MAFNITSAQTCHSNASAAENATPLNIVSDLVSPKENELAELFLNNGNLSQYWEQRLADAINLYYVPVCASVGILGNLFAFLVLILSPLRKSSTCSYMACIACLDICVLTLDVCFFLRKLPEYEIFNEWSCGFIMFMFYFVIHWNVLLILAMTIERYLVVAFPLQTTILITRRKALLAIASLGLFSFFLDIHNVFTRSMVWIGENYICSMSGELNKYFVLKVYSWIDTTIYCFIPVTGLFTLNVLIIRHLRQSKAIQKKMTISKQATGNIKKDNRKINNLSDTKNQRQLTLMLIFVSFAFLLLSAPVAIMILIEKYIWIAKTTHDKAHHNLVHAFIDNLMYTNHAVNFLLYILSGNKFRQEFKRFICCRSNPRQRQNQGIHVAVLAASKWSALSKANRRSNASLATSFLNLSSDTIYANQ